MFGLGRIFAEIIIARDASLKGPKCEMFIAGILTVWVGDLETRPKNLKSYVWDLILPLISWDFCFSAKKMGARSKKELILIASMFTKKLFTNIAY